MRREKKRLDKLLCELKNNYEPDELVKALGIAGLCSERSCLSDAAILRHMKEGTVVIDPFDIKNLATSSYDITLGPNFYREANPGFKPHILNPYDEKHVRRIWQLETAQTARIEAEKHGIDPNDLSAFKQSFGSNISPEDYVILVKPSETILAHTNEYIGGRECVTTMMKARSSLGRNFIAVCKCAGWGDVGYVNRWTMEITNNSQHYMIPLVVGRRIAQIVFFAVEPIKEKNYVAEGKYQTSNDLTQIKREWVPDAMLPKMWKDKEIKRD